MIDSGPMACVAIARALIRPVNRVSYCVGGNRISGGTRAMFVLEPDGDNRELKAPHVPGEVELDFTSTSLSLKSKQPIIHAISFSLFGCELDLQEFSVQTHFLFVGIGLSHDNISHGTASSNV